MADTSPKKEKGNGPQEQENKEKAIKKGDSSKDLPMQREQLLSQVEEARDEGEREKRRRRRRRRRRKKKELMPPEEAAVSAGNEEKEKPPAVSETSVIEEQQIPPVEEMEEEEKPPVEGFATGFEEEIVTETPAEEVTIASEEEEISPGHFEQIRGPEEPATIPPDSKIELASEDEVVNLPPVSMEKAREEEERILEEPSASPRYEEPAPESEVETSEDVEFEKTEEKSEEIQRKIDDKKAEMMFEEGGLSEKKSLLATLKSVLVQAGPAAASIFNVRILGGLVVLAVLFFGGMWIFSQNFFGLLGGEVQPRVPQIPADEQFFREYGLATSMLFGGNEGSSGDRLSISVKVSDYFGTLSEPRLTGETGISAATYFGELLDERGIVDQFVEYMRQLSTLQNLYSVDVYGMLDRTAQRDQVLQDYLLQMRDALGEGQRNLQAVRINIDDLTVSFQSISDDRSAFEEDFFAAMENLEAEKSDTLLKSFVDVSQKQVALRARVAALEKVAEYYETALRRLQNRITAVENNQQALIQGIRVVEVPGASDLDIIIRP